MLGPGTTSWYVKGEGVGMGWQGFKDSSFQLQKWLAGKAFAELSGRIVSANLMTRRIEDDDRIAITNADAVGGVAHDSVPGFVGDGFAEKSAILLVVNGDGGSSLDGGCDGHGGFQVWDFRFQVSGF
jgi:hypothetical protein